MTLDHKTKGFALASLALLANASPALSSGSAPASTQQTLNLASIAAIRASWLKVTPMCKDRSFPFEAVKTTEVPSDVMTRLYAALDQEVDGFAG